MTWDFAIRIHPGDIPGMPRIGLSRHGVRLGLRWVLHRPGRSPGTEERSD